MLFTRYLLFGIHFGFRMSLWNYSNNLILQKGKRKSAAAAAPPFLIADNVFVCYNKRRLSA